MSAKPHGPAARLEAPQKGAPAWMVTFADMMTLLLCFFVLLLAFSTMQTERFKVVAGAMREAFGVEVRRDFSEVPAGSSIVKSQAGSAKPGLEVLFEQIVELMHEKKLDSLVEVTIEDDGLRVTLRDELAFAPGSAELGDQAQPFIDELAALALDYGAEAAIGAHTDGPGAAGDVFASAWELSAARAGAVARRLAAAGVPGEKLSAAGHADSRPIAENVSDEGRYKNRRVEIKLTTP